MTKKPKASVPGVAIIIPTAKGGMKPPAGGKAPAKTRAKKGCRK
ncbi:MAG: hypothetical protein H6Q75_1685 [Firmicutes bacterium]|nr:hypothetical protein [Bacillota bacterium]